MSANSASCTAPASAWAHRKVTGPLVIATHNPGKLAEMRELLAPYGLAPTPASELGLPEPEETGASFISNAVIKARAAADSAKIPALADDSGLCVAALDDAPGINSARWAGTARDFGAAMKKVEHALLAANARPPFNAHFVSALALAFPERPCPRRIARTGA